MYGISHYYLVSALLTSHRPYLIEKGHIQVDLTTERPLWILSSYGPGKQAPEQLFGGYPREQSFEEMRLRHYELTTQGRQEEAIKEAQELVSTAEQQMQTALADLDGAVNYLTSGQDKHPNRIDICNTMNTLGQYMSPRNTHSQPSVFGKPKTPFDVGQADNLFTRVLSGQQNMFPAHYEANQMSNPSQLNGFLTPATVAQGSTLGTPTAPSQRNPMDLQPTPTFGASQSFDTNYVSNTITGLHGQPNPFLKQPMFASNVTPNTAQPQPNSLGRPSGTMPSSTALGQQTVTRKDSSGKLVSWGDKQVAYVGSEPCLRRSDGSLEKIWFPDPPKWNKDQDLPDHEYDREIESEYKYMEDRGIFKDGLMPDLPPRREWCSWNF